MAVFLNRDFKTWIYENMAASRETYREIPWGSVFPYLCHEIQKDRNNCVFHGQEPSPVRVLCSRAMGCAREYLSSQRISNKVQPGRVAFVHHPEYLMIHVDASFNLLVYLQQQGLEGCSSWKWTWVAGFEKRIYAQNSLAGELLAILEALYFVESQNFPKAIFYSDCQNAIDILISGTCDLYANVINSCRLWPKRRPKFQIKYCSREHNQVADCMAKILGSQMVIVL